MIARRNVLKAGIAVTALGLASAHTPYRQWNIYRQRHLLILTSREDVPSYPLGQQIAALLAERLPESQARVTRAPSLERFASLITTGQIDVGVLAAKLAAALAGGAPPFAHFGASPLRALHAFGEHLLLCRDDFSSRHAYLVAKTLDAWGGELPHPADAEPALAWHPGVVAYQVGAPEPERVEAGQP